MAIKILNGIVVQGNAVMPTIYGGTEVSSTLTIRSTTAAGTTDAIIFGVGTNGGTEAMRILNSGRVTIRRTTADYQLDVDSPTLGNIARFGYSNGFGSINILFDYFADDISIVGTMDGTSTHLIGMDVSNRILIGAQKTKAIWITSTGVGIGINAPSTALHISGGFRLVDGTQGLNKVLTSDADGNGTWQVAGAGSCLWTENGTHIYRAGTGNVGIGATGSYVSSPTAKLMVEGTSNNAVLLHRFSGTSGHATGILLKVYGGTGDTYAKGGIFFERTNTGGIGRIVFATTTSTGSTNIALGDGKVFISPEGRLGVGIAAPDHVLDVSGTVRLTSTTFLLRAGTTNVIRLDNIDPQVTFWEAGGGVVGINTTTPQVALHVVGSLRMVDGNQGLGRVMVSDASGTGSWKNVPSIFSFAQSRYGFTDFHHFPQMDSFSTTFAPPFQISAVSSGTITAMSDVENHYGIINLLSSSTTGSGIRVVTGLSQAPHIAEGWVFRAIVKNVFAQQAGRSIAVWIGLIDTATQSLPSTGAFVGLTTNTVSYLNTDMTAYCRTSGSGSSSSTAQLNESKWLIIDIERVATGFKFTVWDDSNTQILSSTLTSGVPTTSTHIGVVATYNTGAAHTLVNVDYMGFGPARPAGLEIPTLV